MLWCCSTADTHKPISVSSSSSSLPPSRNNEEHKGISDGWESVIMTKPCCKTSTRAAIAAQQRRQKWGFVRPFISLVPQLIWSRVVGQKKYREDETRRGWWGAGVFSKSLDELNWRKSQLLNMLRQQKKLSFQGRRWVSSWPRMSSARFLYEENA